MIVLIELLSVFVAILAAIAVGGAVVTIQATNRKTAVVASSVSHAAGLLMLFSVFYFLLPRFKKIFADFGTELPGITKFAIGISDTFFRSPILAGTILFLSAAFAADVVFFSNSYVNEERRVIAKAVSIGVTVTLMGCVVLSLLSVLPPTITLINDLS